RAQALALRQQVVVVYNQTGVSADVRDFCFFFQAEDGIRGRTVTGVQTCALPISWPRSPPVLVIGAMQSLGPFDLPGLLADFHGRHPGVDVVLRENTTQRMLAMIGADTLDLALAGIEDRKSVV